MAILLGIDLEDRTCKICMSTNIEDEYHFTLVCPLYQNLRQKYLPEWSYVNPTIEKFYSLMSSNKGPVILNLAAYVYRADVLRKEFC